MLFFLKQLLKTAIMPVPVIILLITVGLFFLWKDRRPRLGRILVVISTGFLFLLSFQPFSDVLGRSLERQFPAYSGQPVEFIWVLGGGHTSDGEIPLTSRLEPQSLARVAEGIRLAEMNPQAQMVFSGYGGTDSLSSAEVGRSLAIALGVDSTRIIIKPQTRDTREEAMAAAPLVANHSFALVTSATHMARAVRIFRNQGLDPIPAPTGHLVRRGERLHALDLIPSSGNLRTSRQLWYEFLGSIWASVRGPGETGESPIP